MERRRLNGNILSGTGILLLLCGFLLLAYNLWDTNRAKDAAVTAAEQIEDYRDDSDDMEEDEMPEVTIDGITYVGTLNVPSLGLELPVISTLTDDLLKTGPCRYTGSISTNDMVIAAHNYRRHFGQIYRLEEGTEIQFINMNNVVYTYVVEENEVLQPTQISEMIDSDYDLTLFTCTSGGQARYALRCNRVEEE